MKQGTGFPQLFSFLLIIGIGFVMVLIIFFMRSGDAPVTENVDSEFANFKAQYILSGFLSQKFEGDFPFEDPRIIDVLVRLVSDDAISEEEAYFANELGVGGEAFENVPEMFSSLEILHGAQLRVGENVLFMSGVIGSPDCGLVGTAKTLLPTTDTSVELSVCEGSS